MFLPAEDVGVAAEPGGPAQLLEARPQALQAALPRLLGQVQRRLPLPSRLPQLPSHPHAECHRLQVEPPEYLCHLQSHTERVPVGRADRLDSDRVDQQVATGAPR